MAIQRRSAPIWCFAIALLGAQTGCAQETPASATPEAPATSARDIVLAAADGVQVHGRISEAANPRAVVLLFHQAGSSKDEYAAIAPRLNAAGFTTLAIDQRSGGNLFGPNLTAKALQRPVTFLDSEPDLDAAIAWGKARGLPLILWGSSYSAALVVRAAARHSGEVAAVLAFSPGEYLGAPDAVRTAAAAVTIPLFVSAASDAAERTAAQALLAASPSASKRAYLPQSGGLHGSSTLIPARNPGGHAQNWREVEAFLASLSLAPAQ